MTVLPNFPSASPPHDSTSHDPLVEELKQYLINAGKPQALEDAVQAALKYKVPQQIKWGITSAEGFLEFADKMLFWIPHENFEGKDVNWMLCMFYFIFDQPPLLDLQTPILPTSIGKPLTWVSDWIVAYAKKMGQFMDTPESITTESYESFVNSPKYHTSECIVPPGGFKTFNELFTRHLKDGRRPIDGLNDPKTIVFPADSTFDGAWQIQNNSIVSLKNLPWPIKDLLQDSNYKDEFAGGIWMHAILDSFDYHRQHAPVAGIVREAKIIEGAAYMDIIATLDENGKPTLKPVRGYSEKLTAALPVIPGRDKELEAPDHPGYQFLQIRGLITIESPVLGLVAALPIGMAQVSSVVLNKLIKIGEPVEKGQEISNFAFGGSDIVLVFQKKAGLTLSSFPPVTTPPTHYNVGNKLAVANPV